MALRPALIEEVVQHYQLSAAVLSEIGVDTKEMLEQHFQTRPYYANELVRGVRTWMERGIFSFLGEAVVLEHLLEFRDCSYQPFSEIFVKQIIKDEHVHVAHGYRIVRGGDGPRRGPDGPRPPVAARIGVVRSRLPKMAILEHLGVDLDLDDDHAVRLTLARRTRAHDGGLGTAALNGAMIAGIIDCAMSVVGILHFRGRMCGTMHLSIQFMKPVRDPHPVIECRAVRRTPSLVFVEARLDGRSGRSDVMATGIVGSTQKGRGDGVESSSWLAPAGMMADMASSTVMAEQA